MNRRSVLQRAATLVLPAAAWPLPVLGTRPALPPELGDALPGARLLGQARWRYLGFHVYDIRLWSPHPAALRPPHAVPLALDLEYARSLDGQVIAERSLQEMQGIDRIDARQADRWLAQMRGIFPDVNAGDRITGVQWPGEAARFFVNGKASGEVRDAAFTRLFFGIWLSPRTSQPGLRAALLGAGGAAS